MIAVVCDATGRIIRASPEFLALAGCELAGIEGRPFSELFPGFDGALPGEAGSTKIARLRTGKGDEVEVWLQSIELTSSPGRERLIVGGDMAVSDLGVDIMPGWKCLNSIEAAVLID